MIRFLFSEAGSASLSVGEKFSLSLTTLFLGMLVVFAVLLLIMTVILIVGKIFQKVEKKEKTKAPETAPPAVTEPEAAETQEDDGEIVAAIMAAVSICMQEESAEPGSFRVVSFRKTQTKPAWNKK